MKIDFSKWKKEEKIQLLVQYTDNKPHTSIMVPKYIVDKYEEDLNTFISKYKDFCKPLKQYISKELSISENDFCLHGTFGNNLHVILNEKKFGNIKFFCLGE